MRMRVPCGQGCRLLHASPHVHMHAHTPTFHCGEWASSAAATVSKRAAAASAALRHSSIHSGRPFGRDFVRRVDGDLRVAHTRERERRRMLSYAIDAAGCSIRTWP